MSSPADMSSPVQGASSRGSPAGALGGSSPGVVNPTDSVCVNVRCVCLRVRVCGSHLDVWVS